MNEFENKKILGIHISRYIASWINSGGGLYYVDDCDDFADWLRSLIIDGKHLSEDDIYYIKHIAKNGKAELQYSARDFLDSLNSKKNGV